MDLYADLDTSADSLAAKELREELDAEKKQSETLRQQIKTLQSDKERLEAENSILLRNISCLYNTAKSELARRNAQLQRMQGAGAGGSRT